MPRKSLVLVLVCALLPQLAAAKPPRRKKKRTPAAPAVEVHKEEPAAAERVGGQSSTRASGSGIPSRAANSTSVECSIDPRVRHA